MSDKDVQSVLIGFPLLIIGLYIVGYLVFRIGIASTAMLIVGVALSGTVIYEVFSKD